MFPLSEDITLSLVICPNHHVGIAWKSALHHLRALHIACYTMLKLCRHLKELWRGSLCVISVCDHTYLMIEITSSLFFFLISLVSVIPPFLGFRSRISLGVVPIFTWVLFPCSVSPGYSSHISRVLFLFLLGVVPSSTWVSFPH